MTSHVLARTSASQLDYKCPQPLALRVGTTLLEESSPMMNQDPFAGESNAFENTTNPILDNTDFRTLATPQHRLGGYLLDWALAVLTLGIGWLIWSAIVWKDGLTPAKQILGMRVFAEVGSHPASWGHMFIRQVLIPLSIALTSGALGAVTFGIGGLLLLGLDHFWILKDTKRQRLTDVFAKTLVYNEAK